MEASTGSFARSAAENRVSDTRHQTIEPRNRRMSIDLYYWTTPDGNKIAIFLEETGLPYRTVPIHIGRGGQRPPVY
jgi:hypothetical protein